MNFQEKYDEYKQRREAKKFFNQNNDYHLSVSDYIRMFIVGTVIAIFLTISFDFLSMKIGWSFSYFDIFLPHLVLSLSLQSSEMPSYLRIHLTYFLFFLTKHHYRINQKLPLQ